jgi:hypothetical protein
VPPKQNKTKKKFEKKLKIRELKKEALKIDSFPQEVFVIAKKS